MYNPIKPKNIASVKNVNGASLKADNSHNALFCAGKILVRITLKLMANVPNIMKASTLVAHPNPICGCNLWKIIGYKTPPKLLPEAAIPVAKAFFVEKYVLTIATDGTKRHPHPTPTQTACASITCQ